SAYIPKEGSTLKENLEAYIYHKYVSEDGETIPFSSKEIKEAYENEVEKVILSTESTYLARMWREDLLERKGNHNNREYKVFLDNWDENGIPKGKKERITLQDV
ncbi:MAG: hypothetical protein V1718_06130, partial [archaeon]